MKKLISIVVSIFLLFSVFQTVAFANESTESGLQVVTTIFTDLPHEHDYYSAVSYLNQKGVLNGYSDGSFKPDNTINRAEVLKVIFVGSAIDAPAEFGKSVFEDVMDDVWYAPFVMKAYELGIVSGDGVDGGFHGERNVNKAEFLKMLLEANQIKQEVLESVTGSAADVPADSWYAPYVNYAASVGVIDPDANGNLEPNKALTRAEVANMIYLLNLVKGKYNTQLLLDVAELEMIQIDVFVGAGKIDRAKNSSVLAVDVTQQAMANVPEDEMVLGVAKLAKAYDYLVDAFVLGVQKDDAGAAELANMSIDKAGEAWEIDNDTEIVSRHIKEVARSILDQVGGEET